MALSKWHRKSPEAKEEALERNRAWRKNNPELYRQRTIAYNTRPDRKIANVKKATAYKARHLEKYKSNRLRRLYGITLDDFHDLLVDQGYGCAVCLSTDLRGHPGWVVDHNHKTGKVRGILCPHCNRTLGLVYENPDTLRRMADYLEKHNVSD